MKKKIRLGTRKSNLAVIQARVLKNTLEKQDASLDIEIVPISTSGDWNPTSRKETRLSEVAGGKGLFVKEIEQALLKEHIDIAVHSVKDVPSFLPPGLILDHVLPREDPRDAFISPIAGSLIELPEGATIGTSSTRRQAFTLSLRPDLQIKPFRGNVPSRLEKLKNGQVDATYLAVAGLNRLNLSDEITCIMELEEILPSAGQGCIGMQIRDDKADIYEMLQQVHCTNTGLCVKAERSALAELDGSCHTPIGSYATYTDKTLDLRIAILSQDGNMFFSEKARKEISTDEEASSLGTKLAKKIKNVLPYDFLI